MNKDIAVERMKSLLMLIKVIILFLTGLLIALMAEHEVVGIFI